MRFGIREATKNGEINFDFCIEIEGVRERKVEKNGDFSNSLQWSDDEREPNSLEMP